MDESVYERLAARETHHWWYVARRQILSAAVRRLKLPSDARILELGCGTGGNLQMLLQHGHVSAVEPNGFARDAARQFAPAADIRDGLMPDRIPFEPGSFDLVVMFDVLEHLADDMLCLAAARRMVKPGGALLATVPGYPWLWSQHDELHHHLRRYRVADLLTALDAAGWDSVGWTRFNALLLPLVVAVRVLGRMVGRRGRDNFLPPPWVNWLLCSIFGFERYLVGWRVPVGISVMVTARRPAVAATGGYSARQPLGAAARLNVD